ncbi:cellulose biosynthesis protein BcsF [Serratia plymuthica]|jgi:cellulose biosynthesis operon protein BcsF/YhjT|uniref:Celllulose biosynthesis operon protein BcsF/YhjT n=2 Tax=Serratia plymuthica TaxID=82996 RepID=A0A2X4TQA1_SERPL|nr:cellulose biosynthesis protein BcsF [Serratia plymuthica]AGO53135.1 cellulose biosynthesis protein BcsF [Serratia plymuthica 4Rx13]AGP42514.1 celllulose biosynthesis operon protein BcsF/YhjT [Serratia plymuthica S13]AHY05143.1 lipoprotein [Serratia plymuthica]ANJ93360.1 lipoprotein [Serratia plymuthica]ANJ96573.1 lipoprotein [Serratia plymuthica]
MLNLNDIVQLILLCAIIFIPLGYFFHRRFPRWRQYWQNLFLSPRYLKPTGLWVREGSSSQIKRKKQP